MRKLKKNLGALNLACLLIIDDDSAVAADCGLYEIIYGTQGDWAG